MQRAVQHRQHQQSQQGGRNDPADHHCRQWPLHLSPREAEIARLLAQGCANREIGTTLSMAPDTVKWHLKNIFGKLGADNRTQAVLKLQEIGLAAPVTT